MESWKQLQYQNRILDMAKFDGVRMQDLLEVQDPDKDGGITLVFKEDRFLRIKIVDGKLVAESIPE